MNYKEVLKEHGTDIEVALLRFCQDEKLYKRFLERFFRGENVERIREIYKDCLLYTSPSPRDCS